MKLVDELFDYYKDQLTADDEDIDLLVASLMQEFSREDMLKVLSELNYNELYKITGTYIATELRKKMINKESADLLGEDKSHFLH